MAKKIERIYNVHETLSNGQVHDVGHVVYSDGTHRVFDRDFETDVADFADSVDALMEQEGLNLDDADSLSKLVADDKIRNYSGEGAETAARKDVMSGMVEIKTRIAEEEKAAAQEAEVAHTNDEPTTKSSSNVKKGLAWAAVITAVAIGAGAIGFSLNKGPGPADNKTIEAQKDFDYDAFISAIHNEESKEYYENLNSFLYYINDEFADQVANKDDGEKRMAMSAEEAAYLMLASHSYVRNSVDAVNGEYTPETIYNLFGDYQLDSEKMYGSVNDTVIRMFKAYSRVTTPTKIGDFIQDPTVQAQYRQIENYIIAYNTATTKAAQDAALKSSMGVVREMFHLNDTVNRTILSDNITMALPAVNYVVGLSQPKSFGLSDAEQERLDTEAARCYFMDQKFGDIEADQQLMIVKMINAPQDDKLAEVQASQATVNPSATPVPTYVVDEEGKIHEADPTFSAYKKFTDPEMIKLAGFNVTLNPELADLDLITHVLTLPPPSYGGSGSGSSGTKSSSTQTNMNEEEFNDWVADKPAEEQAAIKEEVEQQKEAIQQQIDPRGTADYASGRSDAAQTIYNSVYEDYYAANAYISDNTLWTNVTADLNVLKIGKSENYQLGADEALAYDKQNQYTTSSSFYYGKYDAQDRLTKEALERESIAHPEIIYDEEYSYLGGGRSSENSFNSNYDGDYYYSTDGNGTTQITTPTDITEGEYHNNGVQDRPIFGDEGYTEGGRRR